MNQQDYDHFAELVKRRSGINVGRDKAYLLESRLRSVAGTSGHPDVDSLLRAIRVTPLETVVTAAVEAMTTNETFFFRDNTPFEKLKELLPGLVKARGGQPIRVWCAACSTGQEPYSIAMLFDEEAARNPALKVDILGTDLSEACLTKARSGVYSQFEAQRGLTTQRLMRHFEEVEGGFRIATRHQRVVRWRPLNLLTDFRSIGDFDLVFCRNVLIYFDVPTKAQILARVSERLADHGRLILGAAETVMGVSKEFVGEAGAYGFYVKASVDPARVSLAAVAG